MRGSTGLNESMKTNRHCLNRPMRCENARFAINASALLPAAVVYGLRRAKTKKWQKLIRV
jgi:hypothetical protein